MSTVLLWKEYRQQRAIWIAVAALAVILVVSLGLTLGQASGLEAFREPGLRSTLNMLMLCLIVAYGACSGAGALAGEKETGTLAFLDNTIGQRRPVWRTKVLACVLFTLLHSAFLTALALGLGFASWGMAIALPLVGLYALAWGLLGGALLPMVLPAILVALAGMAAGTVAAVVVANPF